jgi:23S rRNA G2069 N7-methylase RlmK/C1962 C5-methylase RlmI
VVLNTFAYTGSFSVYAAKGGAKKTYSVDLSGTYCEWIRKNLRLNDLPDDKNWIYKMDTMEFFKYAKKKKLVFDIIIIDPPTFSKNKSKSFSVQKDHPLLLNAALEVLSPDGFILFSNNYREFNFKKEALSPCDLQVKTDTIPPDFPGVQPHHCWLLRHKQNMI